MRPSLAILAATLACLAPTRARADILGVGDPAPPIHVGAWVKGEKVEEFEPGKTYVVAFWATWCGPSVASIPRLTELARAYRDKGVRVIGVDVWEDDTRRVAPFVEKMGDAMDFSVALDDTSQALNAWQGMMGMTWLNASREFALPTAFIIHDGKIAWIDHPMAIDEPLARIAAGEWDLEALVKARREEKAERQRLTTLRQKVYALYRAGDHKAALVAADELIAEVPALADQLDSIRFSSYCKVGDVDHALAVGEKLLEQNKDQGMTLNNIFFYAVELDIKPEPDPRICEQALRALRLSDKLVDGNSWPIADSLAVALFRTGDYAGAIAAQERALRLLAAEAPDPSHPNYKTFRAQIARFREAAEKAAPR